MPFLADLVTLVDPTSPWSFLSYLRARERLFPFYFAERFHIQRAEYDAYCRWVAEALPGLRFRHQVDAVRWNPERDVFEVDHTQLDHDGEAEALGRTYTRNIVLGVGTAPHVPDPLRPLVDAPGVPVLHAADYLAHRDSVLAAGHVTVVGSGQSGAEIFLDLLRHRPPGREKLHWIGRTEAFAPMEYSKLGLEHFTPDYTRYFHALTEPVRDRLVAAQWQLHKGIDAGTLAAIHDELYRRTLHGGWPDAVLVPGVRVRTAGRIAATKIELHLEHLQQDTRSRLTTDAVVLATGYRERPLGRPPRRPRPLRPPRQQRTPPRRRRVPPRPGPLGHRLGLRAERRTCTPTASAPRPGPRRPGAAPPSSTRSPEKSRTPCPPERPSPPSDWTTRRSGCPRPDSRSGSPRSSTDDHRTEPRQPHGRRCRRMSHDTATAVDPPPRRP
ncbi:hypothetical protein GCM10017687_19600 [Streptomyces echinatus]